MRTAMRFFVAACLAAGWMMGDSAALADDAGGKYLAYIGTYTGGKSKGIYVARYDAATGHLGTPELAVETPSPSFVAIHPGGKFLYSVGETNDYQGKKSGSVASFAIDRSTGKLTPLNEQPSLGGAPCHLIVDPAGKHVLVANYSGGNVAVLPIQDDGRLSPASSFHQHKGTSDNPERPVSPRAHSINLDAAGKFAMVADLGLDQVLVYRYDAAAGKLTPHDPPGTSVKAGSGPRHFAFHPAGKYAYVLNETRCTVTAFTYDAAAGRLSEMQTVPTVPEVMPGFSTAEILAHPSGKFVYSSNRGHDSIAVFAVDAETGKLTARGQVKTGGKTPRNFFIDPAGKFLLAENQASDTIVIFRIDPTTGHLEPTGQKIDCPSPVCIRMLKE